MSYQADHMAWQQRVGLELNAHRKNLDQVLSGGSQFGANQQLFELYHSIVSESHKGSSAGSRKGVTGGFNHKNMTAYGGRQRLQNPVLVGSAEQGVSFYNQREADTISQASGAYVGKRSTNRSNRGMSAHSKTIKLQGARTFYPNDYYKRVGYQKSEASSNSRVDALGQRVRDRFNEEVSQGEYAQQQGKPGLHHRNLKQLKQSYKQGGPASQVSRQSDVFSQNKRRSVAMAQAASQQPSAKDDVQSVITLDRLRKFNDIQGTFAGNQNDEMNAHEAKEYAMFDRAEGENEGEAAVEEDDAEDMEAEERDEVASNAMERMTVVSRQSKRSTATSKTYISKLEKQLEVEKNARLKLEHEVEEMKKLNAEISSKLGLSNHSAAAHAK